MQDPHEILGVSRGASVDEIQHALRTLTHIYHPDRYVDSPPAVRAEAQRRMQEVIAARRALLTKGDVARGSSGDAPSSTRRGQRQSRIRYDLSALPRWRVVEVVRDLQRYNVPYQWDRKNAELIVHARYREAVHRLMQRRRSG